jgi:hypothetical protein
MTEYAFDIKLWAVCRVQAKDEPSARLKLLSYLDCCDLSLVSESWDGIKLTEASIEDEGEESELFEIDGKTSDTA